MLLETKCDAKAPLDFVYNHITNFEDFETLLMGLGAFVERKDDFKTNTDGMKWQIEGEFRGKHRSIELQLAKSIPNEFLCFTTDSSDNESTIELEFIELAKEQTRVHVSIAPTAKTLSARLILQSAKLARKTLEKRLKNRVSGYLNTIEENYKFTKSV